MRSYGCCVLTRLQGQTLKVTVRLELVGAQFDISDLKLDCSNVSVRELPLKVPSTATHTGARDPRKKLRHEMLVSIVRVLVRTIFMPTERTFNTYLSSMLTVRNNSSTPILVGPLRATPKSSFVWLFTSLAKLSRS